MNEPGSLCWNELTTRHVDEALAFYGAVFGWTPNKLDMGGTDYYELKRVDGAAIGGLMPMIGDMWPPELPDHWMVYFAVDDTDAAAARAEQLGGAVSVPPRPQRPAGRGVLDHQGGRTGLTPGRSPPGSR